MWYRFCTCFEWALKYPLQFVKRCNAYKLMYFQEKSTQIDLSLIIHVLTCFPIQPYVELMFYVAGFEWSWHEEWLDSSTWFRGELHENVKRWQWGRSCPNRGLDVPGDYMSILDRDRIRTMILRALHAHHSRPIQS